MSRAARWLKALFGIKKDKEQNHSFNAGYRRNLGSSGRGKTGLCQNPATIPPNITLAEAAWLKSFYKEQSKHAIAVATATVAAQAAVAVVRLRNQGGRNPFHGGTREISAAVTIQCVFRGYLARKALKALKGLKLQALVRGFMVRKQATAALHGMQALIRAQATVHAQSYHEFSRIHDNFGHELWLELQAQENFDESTSECIVTIHSRRLSSCFEPNRLATDETSKIVEMDTSRPKSRARWAPISQATENFDDSTSECIVTIHSRRLSSYFKPSRLGTDETSKIVEMDTSRPKSRSRWGPICQATVRTLRNQEISRISETCHTHFPESLENFDGTTSECIATIHSRRLSSCFEPNRLATDESSKIVEIDTSRPKSRSRWGPISSPYPSSRLRNGGISCEEWHPSTAQSTTRFVEYNGPVTPLKNVRSPDYMSNTQSFKAKLRSQSAPKQSPELGLKKRLSLKAMESRSSLSGVRMRRSWSKAKKL